MTIIAHLLKTESGEWLPPRELEKHLLGTAQKAQDFAKAFGSSDWAYLAGLWHDLGKYSDDFQEYIKKVSGYKYRKLIYQLNKI